MDDDIIIFLLLILAIVWGIILPIVLPIVFGIRYKRIKNAVLTLYNEGKITREQYFFCVHKQPPYSDVDSPLVSPDAPEIASSPEPVPAESPEIASSPEPVPAESPEIASSPEPVPAESPEIASSPESVPAESPEIASSPEAPTLAARTEPPKEVSNTSTMIPIPVILALGVVLICIAGAAYISSFWSSASEIGKLFAVGSFSLVFYGAFRLAHNKLQIEHSAKAFYILCIAALGITVTAAELFGLILGDAGPAAKMLLPTAVIAAGMFRGFAIFKSRLFPILGVSFVFLFLTALSTVVFDDAAMMFFIPAIVSTGCLVYARLGKSAFATEARNPAFVLFLVFTGLLMCSVFAIENALHRNIVTTFALALAVIMHVQQHKAFNRFVEFAIPVALGWACLTFIDSIHDDPHSIALFIGCILLSASSVLSFVSLRRFDKTPHPVSILLYASLTTFFAFLANEVAWEDYLGEALLIPAFVYIILGANIVQRARVLASQDASTVSPFAAALIALIAGALFALVGYGNIVDDLPDTNTWILNLAMSAALLVIAIVPGHLRFGDIRSRRYASFALLVILAFMQQFVLPNSYQDTQVLTRYPFNQLLFLVPAFAIALIERSNAIRTERSRFAILSHICAVGVVLWIVPLCMVLLNVAIHQYFIWSIYLDLTDYIYVVDSLLLALILLHEPQKSLCPDLSKIRLVIGAVLIGLSYIIISIVQNGTLTGDPMLVKLIPWCCAAFYLAIILFYTFRKRIACPDAPHLRLRAATALCTTMSITQVDFNEKIAVVLLISAIALTVLDDRRSAKRHSPHDQSIAAVIASILFFGLTLLVALKVREIFNVSFEVKNRVLTFVFPSVALLFSLIVLGEHLWMHKREVRPYRLVAAVDLELSAAFALCYLGFNLPAELTIQWMMLATGLIGTGCMSYREHRKYGQITALVVFLAIYTLLETGWEHFEISEPGYFVWIAAAAVTAILAFADGWKRTGITNLRLVWIIAALPLIIVSGDPYHIAHVAGVLIVALNLLQYLRERGKCDHDRVLITISTGIIAIALTLKIMLLPYNSWLPVMIRPELIFLIPVSTLYLDSYFIWQFRGNSHEVCSIMALICLPLVYLIPGTHILFHAITVTALAIVSIIIAVRTRLNRYLTIGIVSIVCIFFSQTQNFWLSLHWWVYLAVVGVILLSIAVLNETQRRKGSTALQLLKGYIARSWKW